MMKLIQKHRNIVLRLMDFIIIVVSYYLATIIIGNSLVLTPDMNRRVLHSIIIAVVVYGVILQIFRTYKNITRYENGNDYLIYVLACLISCTIMIFFNVVPIIDIVDERINLIASLIIVTTLIGYRVFLRMILTESYKKEDEKVKNRNNKRIYQNRKNKVD